MVPRLAPVPSSRLSALLGLRLLGCRVAAHHHCLSVSRRAEQLEANMSLKTFGSRSYRDSSLDLSRTSTETHHQPRLRHGSPSPVDTRPKQAASESRKT